MQNSFHSSMFSMRTLAFVLVTACASGSAFAQWQWLDASGHKVFSDTAPPQGTPEKNILKRPGAVVSAPIKEVAEQAPAAATPTAAKPAGIDPKLEAKRKAAEKEEAAKRQEAEEKFAAARADSCTRAKSARATLQLGTRIQTVNAKGESEILDDNARAAESKRLDGIIASDCGPLPSKSTSALQSRP